MSKSTFHYIKKQVHSTVEKKTIQLQEEQVTVYYLASEDMMLVLSGDFGWSHQQNIQKGTYNIIDENIRKVLYQIILKKQESQWINKKKSSDCT